MQRWSQFLGVVSHSYNPSPWEWRQKELEFKASLGYLVSLEQARLLKTLPPREGLLLLSDPSVSVVAEARPPHPGLSAWCFTNLPLGKQPWCLFFCLREATPSFLFLDQKRQILGHYPCSWLRLQPTPFSGISALVHCSQAPWGKGGPFVSGF